MTDNDMRKKFVLDIARCIAEASGGARLELYETYQRVTMGGTPAFTLRDVLDGIENGLTEEFLSAECNNSDDD